MKFHRVFVEKKHPFDIEARDLLSDLRVTLSMDRVSRLRIFTFYDITDMDEPEHLQKAIDSVLSEKAVDQHFSHLPVVSSQGLIIAMEPVPGQYDQRADSAEQCIRLIVPGWSGAVRTGKVLCFEGDFSEQDKEILRRYVINPLEFREKDLDRLKWEEYRVSGDRIPVAEGFIDMDPSSLTAFREDWGLAMSQADIKAVQEYFGKTEKRNPTETEIRVLDTYWSDHCRHTTFETEITAVDFPEGEWGLFLSEVWNDYQDLRKTAGRSAKPVTLMDLAVVYGRYLYQAGQLDDLDDSDEINACTVKVRIDNDGKPEDWLLLFKNETHNHPTEIEPFGGASTCIGGAIRDPLSGRAYVYQAMRITGSGDPRESIAETLPGKLPQIKITREAAHGYSSYGNQIGLATSHVREIYHPGYKAKRMEVGAVVGAVKASAVRREAPVAGDRVILLGGKTGRDGIGGATGSSREHTLDSLDTCGAEVQKGNAPEERKIQRLFRNAEVTRLIKKCNDFGAGGVSVAIGELSSGMEIFLDRVPLKYMGLNGTEIAISESQERMAVVVSPQDVDRFCALAAAENLETSEVATITDRNRLVMKWKDQIIVNIDRDFLDTHGVRQKITAKIVDQGVSAVDKARKEMDKSFPENLADLNVCSQRGLSEMFDSSIGGGTVLVPYGGRYRLSESECSVHKLPVPGGKTRTVSFLSHGYDPYLSSASPFLGSVNAILESLSRIVASGGSWRSVRFSFQEYFRRLGQDPENWGLPLSSLLGAFWFQKGIGLPAIGGKDSMSGSFTDRHVPPTLISFAVTTGETDHVVGSDLKSPGTTLWLLKTERDSLGLPDIECLKKGYDQYHALCLEQAIEAAASVRAGGLTAALVRMALGNHVGIRIESLSGCDYGSLVFASPRSDLPLPFVKIGVTTASPSIQIGKQDWGLDHIEKRYVAPLASIFPDQGRAEGEEALLAGSPEPTGPVLRKSRQKSPRPRVLIPLFYGQNCEYDTADRFTDAGGDPRILIFRNRTEEEIQLSLEVFATELAQAQILMLVGGFSAGDEPDGSGKYIANVLRNSRIADAVHQLLDRDGLVGGICNGFQALIKSGLLPGGKVTVQTEQSPTLFHNRINRHVARMVQTRVETNHSPWLALMNPGEIQTLAVSHGEGCFVASPDLISDLKARGQIAFRYCDDQGRPSMTESHNPNGSAEAIEGIISPDGRILGRMGHPERYTAGCFKNVPGIKTVSMFQAGIRYFQ